MLFAKYNYNYKVKEDEWDKACSIHGEKRNAYRILVVKPEGRSLGKPRHGWEGIIKMYLREIEWESMDWNKLDQDRDTWRALVNKVMRLRVP
jgi:hypothetical protein